MTLFKTRALGISFLLFLFYNIEAQTGSILHEYWTGISGNTISSLINNTNYPTNPTGKDYLTNYFEAPTNWNDNYGTRIRGYIHPPMSGNYTFWIAGDDVCELWISTDDKQAHKQIVAFVNSYTSSRAWTTYPEQKSAMINLVAGKRYYIEALHKEASGGDNLAVGWQLPDGSYERPIPAIRLSPTRDDDDYSQWSDSAKIFLNTTPTGANILQNVINTPILIRLNSSNFNFTRALTNGADLRFAKADGTHLYYQIERWNSIENMAEIWVKMDTIYENTNSQYINMFWGKQSAVSRSNGAIVFDTLDGFSGVWHLNQDPAGNAPQFTDVSYKNNNGTSRGTMTTSDNVNAIIGTGLDLDGIDDFLSTNNQFTNPAVFTLSLWFKTTTTRGGKLIGFGNNQVTSSSNYDRHIYMDTAGHVLFGIHSGSPQNVSTSSSYNDGNWHNVVGLVSASGMKLYMDGVLQGSNPASTPQSYTGYWKIGYDNLVYWPNLPISHYFQGTIDEVRLSKFTRSDDWIKLSYKNQQNNSPFISFQSSSCKPMISVNSVITTINESSLAVKMFRITAIRNCYGPGTLVLNARLSYSGTASMEADYDPLPSVVSVIIPADSVFGKTDLILSPINDSIDEGNETIAVSLLPDSSYAQSSMNNLTITILDDDKVYPPQVSIEPEDIHLLEGDYGTYTVMVTGTPPFTYQWRRNGVPEGPSASNYTIPSTSLSENGNQFDCIISNSAGKDTTRAALLTVAVRPLPPRFIIQPVSVPRIEDDTVHLSVQVDGTSPFTYQWFRNGVAISGATSSTYITNKLTLQDNGSKYYCQVSNVVNAVLSREIVIIVKRPTSRTIVVTGELYDKDGIAVGYKNSAKMDFQVKLYPSILSDSIVYTEQFLEVNNQGIVIRDGKFSIRLGEGQTEDDLVDVIRGNPNLFVSFTVTRPGGSPEVLEPRTPLSASPFAFSGLSEVLRGTIDPVIAGIEAPIGTYYINTINGNTFIKSNSTWIKQ